MRIGAQQFHPVREFFWQISIQEVQRPKAQRQQPESVYELQSRDGHQPAVLLVPTFLRHHVQMTLAWPLASAFTRARSVCWLETGRSRPGSQPGELYECFIARLAMPREIFEPLL